MKFIFMLLFLIFSLIFSLLKNLQNKFIRYSTSFLSRLKFCMEKRYNVNSAIANSLHQSNNFSTFSAPESCPFHGSLSTFLAYLLFPSRMIATCLAFVSMVYGLEAILKSLWRKNFISYVHSVNITSEGFVPSAVKVYALVES